MDRHILQASIQASIRQTNNLDSNHRFESFKWKPELGRFFGLPGNLPAARLLKIRILYEHSPSTHLGGLASHLRPDSPRDCSSPASARLADRTRACPAPDQRFVAFHRLRLFLVLRLLFADLAGIVHRPIGLLLEALLNAPGADF